MKYIYYICCNNYASINIDKYVFKIQNKSRYFTLRTLRFRFVPDHIFVQTGSNRFLNFLKNIIHETSTNFRQGFYADVKSLIPHS